MNELALFAGAGGGILGGKLLGWRTICAVELDSYAASVLVARQNDGCLEPFPVWDDITTFDGEPWRGVATVVSAGWPCTDISCAGKGAGIEGEKSGLWREVARIVCEVRPRYVFLENSPMLTSRGLGRVLGDLAEMGFNAQWGVLGADDVGAPHIRKRIWIVANASSRRLSQQSEGQMEQPGRPEAQRPGADSGEVANPNGTQRKGVRLPVRVREEHPNTRSTGWWDAEPDVGRVAHGVASRMDRLRCLGNGQVPAVAATAFRLLRERGSA